LIRTNITPFAEWPLWLQVLVPHGVLGFVAFWFWWPKSEKEWRRFGFVAGYLFVVYLVLRFVFDLR
jgi:hypothetical protein